MLHADHGESGVLGGVECPFDLLQAVVQARVADAQRRAGVLLLHVDDDKRPARAGSGQFIGISHGASKGARLGAVVAW